MIIVDKAYAGKSGMGIQASGYWSVFNPDWGHDLDVCLDFVSRGSDYINDRDWTEIILKESFGTYQDLVSWGVEFPVEQEEREARDWYKAVMGLEGLEPGRSSLSHPICGYLCGTARRPRRSDGRPPRLASR